MFKSSIFIRMSGIGIFTHYLLLSSVFSLRQLLSVTYEVSKPLRTGQRMVFLHGPFMLPQRPHRKKNVFRTQKRTCILDEQKNCIEIFSRTSFSLKSWHPFIIKWCRWLTGVQSSLSTTVSWRSGSPQRPLHAYPSSLSIKDKQDLKFSASLID